MKKAALLGLIMCFSQISLATIYDDTWLLGEMQRQFDGFVDNFKKPWLSEEKTQFQYSCESQGKVLFLTLDKMSRVVDVSNINLAKTQTAFEKRNQTLHLVTEAGESEIYSCQPSEFNH